jgi:glyoxylase-like metal-dependent hydrolase (beta-lactamase superfamily II)
MKPLQLGEFNVSRVVESEGPAFAHDFLFPDSTDEALAPHLGRLAPRFIDSESGKLVLSFHSYVIRTGRHVILVDSCVGNDKERPERPNWHRQRFPYLDNLAAAGVRPEEVDFVLCTHMHGDHVGWNTRLDNGRWVPTFPNAKYIFARAEFEFWQRQASAAPPDAPVNHGSFADSVLPVVEAGRAVLVDSDHAIEDGVWLEPAPGHTPGNVVVNLASGGARAVLAGDVIHHPLQFAYPEWSSRFCEDPAQSRATRTALIERLAGDGEVLLTAHFPTPTAGRVAASGEAFDFELLAE